MPFTSTHTQSSTSMVKTAGGNAPVSVTENVAVPSLLSTLVTVLVTVTADDGMVMGLPVMGFTRPGVTKPIHTGLMRGGRVGSIPGMSPT